RRSSEIPQARRRRHGEELSPRGNAEHALPADVALLAELDEIVEQRARHLSPEIAADVEIRLKSAGFRLGLEAQRVLAPARHPVIDIGAEMQLLALLSLLRLELDREERRVLDGDAAFLHRRDQEILVAFAFEHRGEQLHQRRSPDRGLEIEPSAIGRDTHVEVAAKRRIPQMHRRRALARGFARHTGNGLEPPPRLFRLLRLACDLGLLAHKCSMSALPARHRAYFNARLSWRARGSDFDVEAHLQHFFMGDLEEVRGMARNPGKKGEDRKWYGRHSRLFPA